LAWRNGGPHQSQAVLTARKEKLTVTLTHGSVQVQGNALIDHDPDGMLVEDLSYKYTGGANWGPVAAQSPDVAVSTSSTALTMSASTDGGAAT
jgi:hypothetical protein